MTTPVTDFVVFNPTLGRKEGQEDKKILLYYPPQVSDNQKYKNIGLFEGLILFAHPFSPDKPIESLHMEKHVAFFYNPEPDIWFILKLENPKAEGSDTPDESRWDDLIVREVVVTIYKMYKLFNGPLTPCLSDVDKLRAKLVEFLPPIVKSINFAALDLFTSINGIHFLPIDKNVYLRIQSFLNTTENEFPAIRHSVCMYKEHLIWSGLEQDDMRVLYKFLVSFACPDSFNDLFLFMKSLSARRGKDRFITGPENLGDAATPRSAPSVFVGADAEEHALILYQLHGVRATAAVFRVIQSRCSLLNRTQIHDRCLAQDLDAFVEPHINIVVPVIAENYNRKNSLEEQYRYIYFNHMNLALKTSLRAKGLELSRHLMDLLNSMHADFEESPDTVSEVLIRMCNDRWVVGRRSDQREFYVIFDTNKSANLIEINEEVKKLSSTYFNNIFIDS